MGLFSRNEPTSGSGSRTRSSMSSEAQAAELRGRARRRLIGALVLVLAAVIVVPMLFDDTPDTTVPPASLVVIPAGVPPIPAPDVAVIPTPDHTQPDTSLTDELAGIASGTVQQDTITQPQAVEPPMVAATPEAPQPPVAKPEPKPETPAKPVAKPSGSRTDDGSVALALLEGRSPAKPAAAASTGGSFTLQIAAYTTDKDAQSRRDKLISSGVTNAYVENATVNDKSTYRLRVGPFPSRDAAQAAQARLRALGYDNSFISAK
ncbi:MAG: SPOR domain-containing protein [Burkholderiaceae bacterium]|nr:SPOR domain-containing protein [Burkholderiaceae bacterium]